MKRILVLGLLPLMFLEIAGFVVVGRQVGVVPTLGLVLLAMFVGVALMRRQGFGVLARMRQAAAAGQDPGRDLVHGLLILLAGILLLVPGFLTDIAGLLLFIPSVRDLVWRRLRGRMAVPSSLGSWRFRRTRGRIDGSSTSLATNIRFRPSDRPEPEKAPVAKLVRPGSPC